LTNLDSFLQSSSPVSFVVFYTNGTVISEPVPICSSKIFTDKRISLKPEERYNLKYESRCLGETALKMLNDGRKVKAIFYVLCRVKGQMFVAKSVITRIKVSR
jgi:hypothetical protein